MAKAATTAQFATAGVCSSTLSLPAARTDTGAGIPHCPFRIGCCGSISATIGARTRTHSLSAELISSSLHPVGSELPLAFAGSPGDGAAKGSAGDACARAVGELCCCAAPAVVTCSGRTKGAFGGVDGVTD